MSDEMVRHLSRTKNKKKKQNREQIKLQTKTQKCQSRRRKPRTVSRQTKGTSHQRKVYPLSPSMYTPLVLSLQSFPNILYIYIYTDIYIYMGNLYKTWSKHNINTMVSTASTVENIVFRRLGRAQSLKSGLTLVMGNDANGTGQKPGNCRN
jgi:hypothetical protein